MSLAHNGHSQFADSNTGEATAEWLHNGLSELGRQAVAEMNKWGIIIDVSHPSMEANKQTIELSRAPVMASHSSARALDPTVSRNLWDEELLAIRDNGGIAHAVAFRGYLDSEKHAANRAADLLTPSFCSSAIKVSRMVARLLDVPIATVTGCRAAAQNCFKEYRVPQKIQL